MSSDFRWSYAVAMTLQRHAAAPSRPKPTRDERQLAKAQSQGSGTKPLDRD
jgi:hypothetical protein